MEEVTIVIRPTINGLPERFDVISINPFRLIAAIAVPRNDADQIANQLFDSLMNKTKRMRLKPYAQ